MCKCPDGRCLAASVEPAPADYAARLASEIESLKRERADAQSALAAERKKVDRLEGTLRFIRAQFTLLPGGRPSLGPGREGISKIFAALE